MTRRFADERNSFDHGKRFWFFFWVGGFDFVRVADWGEDRVRGEE